MRPLRLRAVLIGTGVTLALGWGASAASAASGHPVTPAKGSAASAAAARARAGALAGTWGNAEEVPGTAALNKAGGAQVNSVSCASAGNCGAGGFYETGRPRSIRNQAFVASESHGTWGPAEEVPGTAALNKDGDAQVESVSCGAAGDCAAVGSYQDGSGDFQVFVSDETGGSWGTAEEVPGTAALNKGGLADIFSVSCPSAGNCSAAGYYTDASGHGQAFVVSETGGTWGRAEEVPGSAALNKGGGAEIRSVSCASAGNCVAGGDYTDGSGRGQVFVANETDGTWGRAEEVPGSAALNKTGDAEIESVSCASAGNCSAGGYYAADGNGHAKAFVVNESDGTWGNAEEVPGTAALGRAGLAQIFSVSCASAGDCSAGGNYAGRPDHLQAFVVSETNGTWGPAEQVPGTAALNRRGFAATESVSCGAAGNCSAVGSYRGSASFGAFVVNETNGTWRKAEQVPGTAALNQGRDADAQSVSCASAGSCSAGGYYTDGSGHGQAFVVSET